jgi:hypothetical protein
VSVRSRSTRVRLAHALPFLSSLILGGPGSVLTKLAREGIPEALHHLLADTPELAAGFALWLATQGSALNFLRGRYVSCQWDVDEILALRENIERKNLLWTRVVGQEQVHS